MSTSDVSRSMGWMAGHGGKVGRVGYAVRLMAAALAGVVYSLAYPPVDIGVLVVVGVGGLLLALRGEEGTRARALGMVHGLAVYGVGLSWLWGLFGPVSQVLWCVLAVFHALFAEMVSRAWRRGWRGWKFAVFVALNWGGWEFIRAELFPLKFPWMTVGLAMGSGAMLPWIGVYASGVVLVLAVALACERKWWVASGLGVALVVSVIGFRAVPALDERGANVVSVGGVQLENVTVDDYIRLTRQLPEGVEHVVWPEYAVPYDIRKFPRDWKLLSDLCGERGITLTFGTKQQEGQEWRNIAMTMDDSGVCGIHNKVHTVHLFDDGMAGTEAGVVKARSGVVGTPVCFDCDYEGIVRRMADAGAEFIVVPVMDAISWSRRQHDQHAELMRMRAAENRKWMFVVGTSGVSMAIDPHGHVHARLGAMEEGTLVAKVKRESGRAFYTRFGWLAPWFVLVAAFVMWVALVFPLRKSR